eukprot:6608-Heterococcus_DN1.PRE.2
MSIVAWKTAFPALCALTMALSFGYCLTCLASFAEEEKKEAWASLSSPECADSCCCLTLLSSSAVLSIESLNKEEHSEGCCSLPAHEVNELTAADESTGLLLSYRLANLLAEGC